MTDDLSRHVLQCGKVMQLLKRLEQHDQTQTARIAAGEARSPFHFVHIGGVIPEQVACRYHTRKPRVCGALEVRHNHLPSRSEEHTSELQSLMRITYAVFRLTKQKT